MLQKRLMQGAKQQQEFNSACFLDIRSNIRAIVNRSILRLQLRFVMASVVLQNKSTPDWAFSRLVSLSSQIVGLENFVKT